MRFVIFLFCLVFSLPALAQELPEYKSITVNDYADLLSDEAEAEIGKQILSLRNDTGIELTVLTLKSQAPYWKDRELEPFATALFNHWGIGHKDRNDGILVMVLSEDRAMRIELGSGFGTEWDRTAADIVNRSFLPEFGDGKYQSGIKTGVTDVIDNLALPFWREEDPPSEISDFGAFSIVAVVLLIAALWRRIGDGFQRLRRCPKCGQRSLHRHREIIAKATRTSKGEGDSVVACTNCTYEHHRPYRISRISRSSSSSFGGGSSSGGGTSGRW